MMCRVKVKKKVTERIRLAAELDEDRGKQSACVLFFFIPEVEKKVGHVSVGVTDILYDCGAVKF